MFHLRASMLALLALLVSVPEGCSAESMEFGSNGRAQLLRRHAGLQRRHSRSEGDLHPLDLEDASEQDEGMYAQKDGSDSFAQDGGHDGEADVQADDNEDDP